MRGCASQVSEKGAVVVSLLSATSTNVLDCTTLHNQHDYGCGLFNYHNSKTSISGEYINIIDEIQV